MKILLIRKVRKFVKQDKIQTTKDFREDFLSHKFKEEDVKSALIRKSFLNFADATLPHFVG